jgi:hypothetical protein
MMRVVGKAAETLAKVRASQAGSLDMKGGFDGII